MPDTIRRADGRVIEYEAAVESEADVLCQHRQWTDAINFKYGLWQQRKALERLVALHVGAEVACVKTGHPKTWRQGAFNVAIPMILFESADAAEDQKDNPAGPPDDERARRVVLRCPLPSNCAETHYPGSILEKMRCEVASYVWMQRHCPQIRIPHLYGFGFPNGTQFTHAKHVSFIRRVVLSVRQLFARLLRRPVPSAYLPVQLCDVPVKTGYMVLEHFGVSLGKQLPLIVRNQNMAKEPTKMRNLFRGVSQIILALARIPQPKIGAFRFNDNGSISLDNRPIACDMFLSENEGAPRIMAVDKTYTNTDQYISDLATFHNKRFLAAPNAVQNENDCKCQMAVRAFLRAVTPHFVNRNHRDGPFALFMTDQNATNIMVDEDWNVTGIFDLEWIISAPVDMPHMPTWLTWDSIDCIAGGGYREYSDMRDFFMEVFKEEEGITDMRALRSAHGSTLSAIMDASWDSKQFWFYQALLSSSGIDLVARKKLIPLFYPEGFPVPEIYPMWCTNPVETVAAKIRDRADYVDEIVKLFA